ncbi:MAG: diaminopimelate dehydrogenase [Oscillospiraceae bacterium]|jgi:diaminopimelate dehydrogenase|nr:diaminopimelate dehydrogenase [Oscillospiraceae bacterium]
MSQTIRIGVCGYGNLGRGVEAEIVKNPDMELAAVFTRRKPAGSLKIKADVPVAHTSSAPEWKDKIDVLILCGGSANDLPAQGPEFAGMFNTVDSFDTHAKIPEYLKAVDEAAKAGGRISVISAGWDPGLFSLMRLYMEAVNPDGKTYTFWGRGVSQGHSEAVRGLDGVLDAIQYTIPDESAAGRVRNGETPGLTVREKHTRLCYVAAEEGADKARIEREIKEMPYYFSDYDTTVTFISLEELRRDHGKLTHGGNVIHTAKTGAGNRHLMEFSLKLDSNPEFTASVLLACARAAYRLFEKGERGARTMFDIPPVLLSRAGVSETVQTLL